MAIKHLNRILKKALKVLDEYQNLPKGTAENGATYIHASMFGAMSLFAIGEGKQAWDQLEKLLPFTHDTVSVSPFVVPNSYGDNEEFHMMENQCKIGKQEVRTYFSNYWCALYMDSSQP